MAVIVQALIPADASGVIFTADPITGRSDWIIIEATFGLGDLLVCGKVTGDRFVIDKNSRKIISCTISDKPIMSVPTDAGVREMPVDPHLVSTTCIDQPAALRPAEFAGKVEAEFGQPQDIEWAVSGNQIFLLQSRPITAISKEKSWHDRQIWSNLFAQEVMPDVVTPLTWSFLQNLMDDFFDPIFRALCMDRGDHPVLDRIAGRAYFNANIWIAVIRALPGVRHYDFTKMAGSRPRPSVER